VTAKPTIFVKNNVQNLKNVNKENIFALKYSATKVSIDVVMGIINAQATAQCQIANTFVEVNLDIQKRSHTIAGINILAKKSVLMHIAHEHASLTEMLFTKNTLVVKQGAFINVVFVLDSAFSPIICIKSK